MTSPSKIPATIVTGFLGAGKSTLIQRLLRAADGKRIALIVNEFGDMGFDKDLISDCGSSSCGDAEMIELTNGCICCTVADDFLPAMETILARDPAPDHIVIETSGLALPQPLVAAFGWPTVKHRVTVDGVITVVDTPAVSQGRFVHDHEALETQRAEDEALDHEPAIHELFHDQLICADLVLLSKTDTLETAQVEKVRHTVQHNTRPGVETVPVPHNDASCLALFGLGSASEDDIANRQGHHHHDDDHDHDHSHDHHDHHDKHDHDAFESFVIDGLTAPSLDAAADLVRQMAEAPGVLRIKGHVAVSGKPPAIIQAVGTRVEAYFARPGTSAETRLVVIGVKGLNLSKLRALADAA